MRIPRTVRVSALLSCVLTLTLTGAVGSAMRAPAAFGLPLVQGAVLDYAQDAPGTFLPLDLGLVEELVGPGGLAGFDGIGDLIASGGGGVVPIEQPGGGGGTTPPGGGPGGGSGPPMDDDPPRAGPGSPGLGLGDQGPRLSLTFSADRATADPGDRIRYAVLVRNVGTETASTVRIDTHVPEHTTYLGVDACDGQPATVLPQSGGVACVDGDDVIPPQGYGPEEHFGKSITKLLPGEYETFRFSVRVKAGTEAGTRLQNHAHVTAVNMEPLYSGTVTVVVT